MLKCIQNHHEKDTQFPKLLFCSKILYLGRTSQGLIMLETYLENNFIGTALTYPVQYSASTFVSDTVSRAEWAE